MRMEVILTVTPDVQCSHFQLEIWDYDRETRVRPIYTLDWYAMFGTDRPEDHALGMVSEALRHARHRINAELAESVRHRPLGLS